MTALRATYITTFIHLTSMCGLYLSITIITPELYLLVNMCRPYEGTYQRRWYLPAGHVWSPNWTFPATIVAVKVISGVINA